MESLPHRSFPSGQPSPTSPVRFNPRIDDAQRRPSNASEHTTPDLRSDAGSGRSNSVSSHRKKAEAFRPANPTEGWGHVTPRISRQEHSIMSAMHNRLPQPGSSLKRKRHTSQPDSPLGKKPKLAPTSEKAPSTPNMPSLRLADQRYSNDTNTPTGPLLRQGSIVSTATSSSLTNSSHNNSTSLSFKSPRLDSRRASHESKKWSPCIFIDARVNKIPHKPHNAKHLQDWLEKYDILGVEFGHHGFYAKFSDNECAQKCYKERNLSTLFISTINAAPLGPDKTVEMELFLKEPVAPAVSSGTGENLATSSSAKRSFDESNSPTPKQSAGIDNPKSPVSGEASEIDAAREAPTDQPASVTAFDNIDSLERASEYSTLIESSDLTAAVQAAANSGTPVVIPRDGDGNVMLATSAEEGPHNAIVSPAQLEKEPIRMFANALPNSSTRVSRSPPEDDTSSVATPSELSSESKTRKLTSCHECKNSHTDARNSFIRCSVCPRRFHKSCQLPPQKETQPTSSWRCYHCLKKARLNGNRTPSSKSMSGSPAVSDSAKVGPEAPAKATATTESPASAQHGGLRRRSVSGREKKAIPELHLDVEPGQYWIAKIKGYLPWPSIVCDEEMLTEELLTKRPVSAMRIDGTHREDFLKGGKNARDRRYPVMFLHTNEFAWILNTNIQPLDMDEVKKEVETGPHGKAGRSLDLWNAYCVAAENHGLAWFKNMLAEHDQAVDDYNAAQARGDITAYPEQRPRRKIILATSTPDEDVEDDGGSTEASEASDSDAPRSENESTSVKVAEMETRKAQTPPLLVSEGRNHQPLIPAEPVSAVEIAPQNANPSIPTPDENDTPIANGSASSHSLAPTTQWPAPENERQLSTFKTSQFGPKRACDACRKRRILCKHKAVLAESQQTASSPQKNASSPPGLPVKLLASDIQPAPLVLQNLSEANGPMVVENNRSGRVKSCLNCRKSKRRCVHDEYGRLYPIKTSDAPVPESEVARIVGEELGEELSDADASGFEEEKRAYFQRSEDRSRDIGAAEMEKRRTRAPNLLISVVQNHQPLVGAVYTPTVNVVPQESNTPEALSRQVDAEKQQASDYPDEELTDGSMDLDPPSSEGVGAVDSSTTSVNIGGPEVKRAPRRDPHEYVNNQLGPGNLEKTRPPKTLVLAPRSKSKAVRCKRCKGPTLSAAGREPICTKCRNAKAAATQQNTAQPTSPSRCSHVLSPESPARPSDRSLEDPMDLDFQGPDYSISRPKDNSVVENRFGRDRSSSISSLSPVPSERTDISYAESNAQPEVSEAPAQESSSLQHPSRKLLLREINGLALLSLEDDPTVTEIIEWFHRTFPYYAHADLAYLKKNLLPVLHTDNGFTSSQIEGEPKRWRFSHRDIKRKYARELSDFLASAQVTSPNDKEIHSETENREHEKGSISQSTTTSTVGRLQGGGSHWQQITRGVYRLSKGPAADGDSVLHSLARKVHLKDVCYSVDDEAKYLNPDGKGDGKEAWGKIDKIELLEHGRCHFRMFRYVDKDEASTLGCRNLREWPRQIKYMRRAQPVMDEISRDDMRGCLSSKESNRVSPALYLALEGKKYKIRVDPSKVDHSRMRHGEDWVESSSDVEDFDTALQFSPRNRTSTKPAAIPDQASEALQKDTVSSKEPTTQPAQDEIVEEGNVAPMELAAHRSQADKAVQTDLGSPKPHTRLPDQEHETTRAALPSPTVTGNGVERGVPSEKLFDPSMIPDPKRMIVEKDFNVAFPEYTTWTAEERERKIKEIQQRPSRKATFGKRLAFARTHRSNPHVEVDPPKRRVATTLRRPILQGHSEKQAGGGLLNGHDEPENSDDEELAEASSTTPESSNRGLREHLGLPQNFIPIVYENQLAFRDGTLVNGRLPRTKVFYKVGRNVAGELI